MAFPEYLNFTLSNISCCRLLRESKNPIKMQMITTQYKLRMNLFTTKSKKPMTGQNIPTNRRRNTRRFSSNAMALFLDNSLGFYKISKFIKISFGIQTSLLITYFTDLIHNRANDFLKSYFN